jgi:hypothetical protein
MLSRYAPNQYATLTTLINTYKQLINTSSLLAQTMALTPGTLILPSSEALLWILIGVPPPGPYWCTGRGTGPVV